MGIVHNATTVDLGTGYAGFHDMPKDCRRAKNDGTSPILLAILATHWIESVTGIFSSRDLIRN